MMDHDDDNDGSLCVCYTHRDGNNEASQKVCSSLVVLAHKRK